MDPRGKAANGVAGGATGNRTPAQTNAANKATIEVTAISTLQRSRRNRSNKNRTPATAPMRRVVSSLERMLIAAKATKAPRSLQVGLDLRCVNARMSKAKPKPFLYMSHENRRGMK